MNLPLLLLLLLRWLRRLGALLLKPRVVELLREIARLNGKPLRAHYHSAIIVHHHERSLLHLRLRLRLRLRSSLLLLLRPSLLLLLPRCPVLHRRRTRIATR